MSVGHKHFRTMKRVLFFICVACLLSSCSMKTYYQVYQTKPVSETGYQTDEHFVVYSDDNVDVKYNFFGENGNAGFMMTNKTDMPIYLHLDESCFVLNGIASDYYMERSWEDISSHTTTFTFQRREGQSKKEARQEARRIEKNSIGLEAELHRGNAASAGSSSTTSSSLSHAERAIVMIPPHASKVIYEYSIEREMIPLCGVKETPMGSKSSGRAFTYENSPVVFANYLTYTIGSNTAKNHVMNEFYVSEVTNVGEKGMYVEVKPTDICGKEISGKKNLVTQLNYNTPDRFYVKYLR